MRGEISQKEIMAGIIFGIAFSIQKAFLVFTGLISSPLGTLGAYGFVLLTTVAFTFVAIVVLGWLGDNWVGDAFAMAVIWILIGLIALMTQFYSVQYFALGLIVTFASAAIAAKVHRMM